MPAVRALRWLWFLLALVVLPVFGLLVAQQTHRPTTEVYDFLNGVQVSGAWAGLPMPATQTLVAGNTVTADACGGLKRISSGGAVTTDTTNTFSAPSPLLGRCVMIVCNVGASTITLDKNPLFLVQGGIDLPLPANSCITVGSEGTLWRQLTALQTST